MKGHVEFYVRDRQYQEKVLSGDHFSKNIVIKDLLND
jgi:hypothetical protein